MKPRQTKGASETLGFILIIGLTLGSSVFMISQVGQPIQQLESTADTQAIESELTILAKTQAEVGYLENRQIINNSKVRKLESVDTSEITIYQLNNDGSEGNVLYQTTLSGYTHETEDYLYHIESGGVFRTAITEETQTNTDERTQILTKPTINYNDDTLTLPLITSSNTPSQIFSPTYKFTNTGFDRLDIQYLESEQVKIVVEGETYHAWGQSFEKQTDGETTYNTDEQTSEIVLGRSNDHPTTVDDTVISGSNITISNGATIYGNVSANNTISGADNVTGEVSEGSQTPPNINTYIAEKTSEIQENGEEISITNNKTITSGQYYTDSVELDGGTTVFNADTGSIDLVVTESFRIQNDAQIKIKNTSDTEKINIYLNDSEYTVSNGSPSVTIAGDDMKHHVVYGTTESKFTVSQSASWDGIYYAPKTEPTGSSRKSSTRNGNGGGNGGGAKCNNTTYDACIGGNATVNGTVISGKTVAGQSSTVNIDESVYDFEPVTEELNKTDTPELIYLQVSESKIKLAE